MFGRASPVSHKRGPSRTRSLAHLLPLNLRNVAPDFCPDFASDARLTDDMMADCEWVYRSRGAIRETMRLKLAALGALILLCLICAGCPDESQQQSSRNAHPRSVAMTEYSSGSGALACAGAAIIAAFLCRRKEAGWPWRSANQQLSRQEQVHTASDEGALVERRQS
jgi:hypothetical protein